MFGHNFGNHFWSPFWEPILLLRCAKFGGVGDIAAHISTHRPCRHDEQTTNASRHAKSNTAARVSDGLACCFVRPGAPRRICCFRPKGILKILVIATCSQNGATCLRIRLPLGRALTVNICAAIRETARQGPTLKRTGPRRIAACRVDQSCARV